MSDIRVTAAGQSLRERIYALKKNRGEAAFKGLVRHAAQVAGTTEFLVYDLLRDGTAASIQLSYEQKREILAVFGYRLPEIRDPDPEVAGYSEPSEPDPSVVEWPGETDE